MTQPNTDSFDEDIPPNPGPGTPTEGSKFNPAKWRERTRAGLAFFLSILLALVVLPILGAVLYGDLTPEVARELLGVLLSPLVGLVGAATGFYYGKRD